MAAEAFRTTPFGTGGGDGDGFMALSSAAAAGGLGGRMGSSDGVAAASGGAVDLSGEPDASSFAGGPAGATGGSGVGGSRRHAPYRPVASYADDHLNDLPLLEGQLCGALGLGMRVGLTTDVPHLQSSVWTSGTLPPRFRRCWCLAGLCPTTSWQTATWRAQSPSASSLDSCCCW